MTIGSGLLRACFPEKADMSQICHSISTPQSSAVKEGGISLASFPFQCWSDAHTYMVTTVTAVRLHLLHCSLLLDVQTKQHCNTLLLDNLIV